MAHKKAGGSTRNGRDSNPKYLGFKRYAGEVVMPGCIILRQRGSRFHAGDGAGMGRDYTIYATHPGKISIQKRGHLQRRYIEITPIDTDHNAGDTKH